MGRIIPNICGGGGGGSTSARTIRRLPWLGNVEGMWKRSRNSRDGDSDSEESNHDDSKRQSRNQCDQDEVAIFVDGSALSDVGAGWGFVAVQGIEDDKSIGGRRIAADDGPLVLGAHDEGFVGAKVNDSTSAELSAICNALRWLLNPDGVAREWPVVVRNDVDRYAAWVQGDETPNAKYIALVETAQALLHQVRQTGRRVRFLQVKSRHGSKDWHDTADALARRAMRGISEPVVRSRKGKVSARSQRASDAKRECSCPPRRCRCEAREFEGASWLDEYG